MPVPDLTASSRSAISRLSFGCGVKSAGTRAVASATLVSTSLVTAVLALQSFGLPSRPFQSLFIAAVRARGRYSSACLIAVSIRSRATFTISSYCACVSRPSRDQPLGVLLARLLWRRDLPVHHRLGEARLVLLVVAVLAVAPQVDHHVALELLAERDRQLGRPDARLGVVAVHVEDRRLDHPWRRRSGRG